MRAAISLSALMLAAAPLGCGSRTGLRLPDASASVDAASHEAGLDARIDARPADSCIAREIAVTPLRAEVMFVLDRSTSMGWSLTGPSGPGPSRWSILLDALHAELPRYDATTDMGMLLFPSDDSGSFCDTAPEPQLAPREGASSSMLAIVDATGPGGRTPTAGGMAAARDYFVARPDASRVRAVVLATDGAPNCNPDLDGNRCPCTAGGGLPVGGPCAVDPALCLDDARSVEVLESLRDEGVPTYVVGIDGDPDPALSAVLSRLAIAGGRPNPLDPRRGYYSVRRPADLAAAFDRIQTSIERCTMVLEDAPPSGAALELAIDGVPVARDPSRTEGWDWIDESERTITLRGEPCTRVQLGSHTITMSAGCAR